MQQIPTNDCITSLNFHKHSLLISSWDTALQLITPTSNHSINTNTPILDSCFSTDGKTIYACGLNSTVSKYDIEYSQHSNLYSNSSLGQHNDAVSAICVSDKYIITGSWDKSIKLYDSRSKTHLKMFELPDKVYSMDVANNKLVIAMANRNVSIIDLTNASESSIVHTKSPLKLCTRTVKCMPNGHGYAISSIEGRIGIEYFSDVYKNKYGTNYAFKCHRQIIEDTDIIYPVHALAYNQKFGTFASGGGDGLVNIWDGITKKRIKQFSKYPSSIAALAFNEDSSVLAIGCSSLTFDSNGQQNEICNAVYVRELNDTDCRPKA